MSELCDLAIHVNGQQTFFLSERTLSLYSLKVKEILREKRQERRPEALPNKNEEHLEEIDFHDFPGGADGFELICRFCYSHGNIEIAVSNVCLLHCCAISLGMTEEVSTCNLLQQTQRFLETIFYWTWDDILASLKSCKLFFSHADSNSLVEKLISALMAKIAQNSDTGGLFDSCSSSPLSPVTVSVVGSEFSSLDITTPEQAKPVGSSKQWWFNDLSTLPPMIIQTLVKNLAAFGPDNNSIILTKFLLHYLKKAARNNGGNGKSCYSGLVETAAHGVITLGKSAFSCRGLFWVLKTVAGFGLRKDCRAKLETLIGGMLDQATLDDLLFSSGHNRDTIYDANLVLRLTRIFVTSDEVSLQKMKIVGGLVDKYLGEISPDQKLKVSKFLCVAESLPDSARDCYDGLYKAIDIYLESHPNLSFENRSKLCRCLNYKKLTFEACKYLAKNPRIPPNVAVEALISQQSKISNRDSVTVSESPSTTAMSSQMVLYEEDGCADVEKLSKENEDMKINIQRMQWKVIELEKACREMKNRMSRFVRQNSVPSPSYARALPRLC